MAEPVCATPGRRAICDSGRETAFDPRLQWRELLDDGTRVLIRPIRREDEARERAFLERLSPQSRYYRFLGNVRIDDAMLKRLTDIDYAREMALIALVGEPGGETEIGISRFGIGDREASCECAVVVADEWQRRGVGHLLMRHLIDVARARGFTRMYSIDAPGNLRMRELAASLGFSCEAALEAAGPVVYNLAL